MAENRVTQEAVEVIREGASSGLVTQESVEVLREYTALTHAGLTQMAVEVIGQYTVFVPQIIRRR